MGREKKKFIVWFVEASNSCSGGDRLLPELTKLRRFVINDKKKTVLCFLFTKQTVMKTCKLSSRLSEISNHLPVLTKCIPTSLLMGG